MLTESSRLADFPSLAGMCYLNTAAEGIPPRSVIEALARYAEDKTLGMDGRRRHEAEWEAALALAGRALGLSPAEVGICSCTSEAYNLAALALGLRAGDEVVVNDLDFPAGVTPWLQPSCPATVRLWKSVEGRLRVEDLRALLGPRTRLVTLSLVSFYNGFRVPLEEVVRTVRALSPALLAVDVTQALGRIPLELRGVDLVVSSTHKWILASHGGGIVGVPAARERELTVPAGGWFNLHDAFGPARFERPVTRPGAASFTVGMPNYPAVYAIRAGLEYILAVGVERIDEHCRPLVDGCMDELRLLPVELLTPGRAGERAGILAFRHPRADALHARLHERGIHIMAHAGRLRVAIHGYTTEDDLRTFASALREALDAS